jgi:dTDP-4-dehydrorhamnose reductase
VRVLLTGSSGQVGTALRAQVPPAVELHSVTHSELDISDAVAVRAVVHALRPDVVLNAAAYTQVDRAEAEPAAAESGNVTGPGNLAAAVAEVPGARLIHLSTDFVFDGAQRTPYLPEDEPAPLGVYGRTKLNGERVVTGILGERVTIIRTAWVYAATGRNFLNTMLRLMRAHGRVHVVADQRGTPTLAESVAIAAWRAAELPRVSGILHWTDQGETSWHGFAQAIADEAVRAGVLESPPEVVPIATSDYPTAAVRPKYSVLSGARAARLLGLKQIAWPEGLIRTISGLASA